MVVMDNEHLVCMCSCTVVLCSCVSKVVESGECEYPAASAGSDGA